MGEQNKTAEKWVMVPVEPTGAMCAAAIGASLKEPEPINGLPQWRAMLAAAPKAEPAQAPMTLAEFCAEADRIGLTVETLASQLAQRPDFADCLPSAQPPAKVVREGLTDAQMYKIIRGTGFVTRNQAWDIVDLLTGVLPHSEEEA